MQIQYAGYGVWNNVINVTQVISQEYARGQRVFTAQNNYGGDPAPGERKYLFIVWNNGQVHSGVTGEGDNRGIQLP